MKNLLLPNERDFKNGALEFTHRLECWSSHKIRNRRERNENEKFIIVPTNNLSEKFCLQGTLSPPPDITGDICFLQNERFHRDPNDLSLKTDSKIRILQKSSDFFSENFAVSVAGIGCDDSILLVHDIKKDGMIHRISSF